MDRVGARLSELTIPDMQDLTDIPAALTLYMDGLRSHDIEKIGASFADEIHFITPTRTMARGEILAFLGALYRGFPNWSYDHDHPVRNEDGTIGVKWRQGGTHTGTLAFPGFEPYPPTGREVVIPEHYFFYKVAEGGLLQIRPDPVPGGAPRGIFEQIGVALPPL